MNHFRAGAERFKAYFLNNKAVIFLLVLLLLGINIFVLNKISFIFTPVMVMLKTILLPIILSGIGYYLLNPIVNYLERKKIKRGYSILALYLLIAAILVLLIVAVVPFISGQVSDFISSLPDYIVQLQNVMESIIGTATASELLNKFHLNSPDITSSLSQHVTNFIQNAWSTIGSFVGAVTEIVLSVVMVPLILFYLLKDGKRLPDYLKKLLPTRLRPRSGQVLKDMNHQISTYIRGQIIVSFCIGVLLYIGYVIIGLKYSLILAVVAACTAVIPYLGPAIAITPALVVAIVTSPIMLLKMLVIWTIVQLIEGKFISPQIMGKSLQVHPITILFVILTSGHLFGVVGVILAVPGYAVLKVIVVSLFDWFKMRTRLYDEEDGADGRTWPAE
ncbi:AI-2E family transporter [Paenibacillus protaetiae]|uniref:AI-2E family transporter n=1 Tax=Paenibacillus protaetiae TaxID=2509456 RepID=A0A4P6EWX3_9BACL|nr:AI-2E family transporter [Paenibacillus protaetiae]QAY67512.1 AI-2E family transporter [Paenibacillus protaetiae]